MLGPLPNTLTTITSTIMYQKKSLTNPCLSITAHFQKSLIMSKKPTIHNESPSRTPTHVCDPQSYDALYLRIRFDLLDFEHDLWGWNTLSKDQYIDFLKFVKAVEKQTWTEIKSAAGGKRHGTNSHNLEISRFDKKAQDRLEELNLYTLVGDSLFSLRMNNVTRIYGAREGEFFRPIWYDPHHDEQNKAAYPLL